MKPEPELEPEPEVKRHGFKKAFSSRSFRACQIKGWVGSLCGRV